MSCSCKAPRLPRVIFIRVEELLGLLSPGERDLVPPSIPKGQIVQ